MTTRQPSTIVGREAELDGVEQFLDSLATGPAALVLEGDIGIGKSTLWQHALLAASQRSYDVLQCRPIESETQLAYAALGDLLGDVSPAALAELPVPQRKALEVALLRQEPDEQPLLPRAVALGLLGALQTLARESPVVIAIDDVQWIDQPSGSALSFVARRLTGQHIGMLMTRRADETALFPLGLERGAALPAARVRRIAVQELAAADVDDLVRERLGARLPRTTLERVHRASGGNPFFALEIARAVLERGDAPLEEDVPITPTLQQLLGQRITRLPRAAVEVLQVTAAASRPTIGLIQAVCGAEQPSGAIAAASEAGLVVVAGERVTVTHPLLASVAYLQLPPSARRDLHVRIAAALDDPEERGRHLALGTDRPDERVARALDDAARRAKARGAPDAAAELWQHARRLTPAGDAPAARRRGVEAAERLLEAGDTERARAVLEHIVADAPPGTDRALALARLGWVRAHADSFRVGMETFRAALDEHVDDVGVRIEIEDGLAWCIHAVVGMDEAIPHARNALALARRLGDPTVLAGALSHLAFLTSLQGHGIDVEMIEDAVAIGAQQPWSQILGRPDWIHAMLLQWADDLDGAHARCEALWHEAVDAGDEHSLPFILFQLARAELLRGDWPQALSLASECQITSLQSGSVSERPFAYAIEALVQAHHGLVEPAQTNITTGLELADQVCTLSATLELLAARGFLELSLGDHTRAEATFADVIEIVNRTGIGEPALFRYHGDAIETKVALGRLDEASAMTEELTSLGARLDRQSVNAIAARCRGLVSAASGDLTGAYPELDRAVDLGRHGQPFEHARTLLVLGAVQRRDKKRALARESLSTATERFEQLGARLWAVRAHAELGRVGGRARQPGLTPTEARVAALIASGLTYREAAAELFVSTKTVQWNLSKVYRKLGIRSRAELPGRLAAERVEPE